MSDDEMEMEMEGIEAPAEHVLCGTTLIAGKPKKIKLTSDDVLQISQLSQHLGSKSRSVVTITYDQEKFVLCSLTPGKTDTWALDISLYGPRDILFETTGGNVDLFGYAVVKPEHPLKAPQAPVFVDVVEEKNQLAKQNKAQMPELQSKDKSKKLTEDEKRMSGSLQWPVHDDKATAASNEKPAEKKKRPAEEQAPEASKKAKKEQPKKEEAKKEQPKKDEAKKEQPKKEEAKKEQPKKDEKPQNAKKTLKGGLVIEDVQVGTGKVAKPGSRLSMHYTGRLSKGGKQFDSSRGSKPFQFRLGLGEVIRGWDIGIEGMKEGGKRILRIPAELGYGKSGAPPAIPPKADLTFDVELLKVQ